MVRAIEAGEYTMPHLIGRPSGSCWGADLRPLPSVPLFSCASSSSTSPPSSAWNLLSRLSVVPSYTAGHTSSAACLCSAPCAGPQYGASSGRLSNAMLRNTHINCASELYKSARQARMLQVSHQAAQSCSWHCLH